MGGSPAAPVAESTRVAAPPFSPVLPATDSLLADLVNLSVQMPSFVDFCHIAGPSEPASLRNCCAQRRLTSKRALISRRTTSTATTGMPMLLMACAGVGWCPAGVRISRPSLAKCIWVNVTVDSVFELNRMLQLTQRTPKYCCYPCASLDGGAWRGVLGGERYARQSQTRS